MALKRIHIYVKPGLVVWGVPLYRVGPGPFLRHIHPLRQDIVGALGLQLQLGPSKRGTRHHEDIVGDALQPHIGASAALSDRQLCRHSGLRWAKAREITCSELKKWFSWPCSGRLPSTS